MLASNALLLQRKLLRHFLPQQQYHTRKPWQTEHIRYFPNVMILEYILPQASGTAYTSRSCTTSLHASRLLPRESEEHTGYQ